MLRVENEPIRSRRQIYEGKGSRPSLKFKVMNLKWRFSGGILFSLTFKMADLAITSFNFEAVIKMYWDV